MDLERLKHDIINHFPGIVYVLQVEPEMNFVYVNDKVEELTGYSPNEHYTNPNLGTQFVHPSSAEALQQGVERALTGDSTPFTIKWKRKDGEAIWTRQQLVRLILDDKIHLIGYARDITKNEAKKRHDMDIEEYTRICSYCKRIFHQHKWKQVENYIMEVNTVQLTHGICSSCKTDYSNIE